MAVLADDKTRFILQLRGGVGSPSDWPFALPDPVALVGAPDQVLADRDYWEGTAPANYATLAQALDATGARASSVVAPPDQAAAAILEAVEAGLELVVAFTSGLRESDRAILQDRLTGSRSLVIGPGCPDLIQPGRCHLGALPGRLTLSGSVGILAQSSALARSAVSQTSLLGLGQSAIICPGARPLQRNILAACLARLGADPETQGVVLLLDRDTRLDQDLVQQVAATTARKPVVALLEAAPIRDLGPDRKVVSLSHWSRGRHVAALEAAGALIVEQAGRIGMALQAALGGHDSRPARNPRLGDFAATMRRVEQEVYGPC